MQRLGLAFLACKFIIGATGTASAGSPRDEGAVRGLGDAFANAFIQKNAELRASIFAEDGTFVTPQGDFLQGRVEMVKALVPRRNSSTTERKPRSPTTGSVSLNAMSRPLMLCLPCAMSTVPLGRLSPCYRSTFSS